jgi:hypothetical protein
MTPPPSVERHDASGADSRWTTYVAVLLVEAAVIAGLWAFGLYFSS